MTTVSGRLWDFRQGELLVVSKWIHCKTGIVSKNVSIAILFTISGRITQDSQAVWQIMVLQHHFGHTHALSDGSWVTTFVWSTCLATTGCSKHKRTSSKSEVFQGERLSIALSGFPICRLARPKKGKNIPEAWPLKTLAAAPPCVAAPIRFCLYCLGRHDMGSCSG